MKIGVIISMIVLTAAALLAMPTSIASATFLPPSNSPMSTIGGN